MRIEKVVINSSPLIVLFRSGQDNLLPQLFKTVVVPEQVYEEVTAGKKDNAAIALPQSPWVQKIRIDINLSIAAWNLGTGESAVFSFALQEQGYRALVDDLMARRCAQAFNIKTLGTAGLLVLAKRRGLINSVSDRVNRLRDAGLYLSDTVVQMILSAAEE
jgi:predicted nucleic acid-binding protein